MIGSRGDDITVRDDDGEVVAMVTVSPVGCDGTTARAIADLIRSRYRTTADVDVEAEEGDDA